MRNLFIMHCHVFKVWFCVICSGQGMRIRLGGFWGLFFNSILPQNSDGDFVSGNHKKIFLVIRKFFTYQKWQFKNSNLHYMSFFQSCSILTFYSLKWSSQWVGSENIYVRGYLIYCLGDTASDRVQKGHFGLGSHFGP